MVATKIDQPRRRPCHLKGHLGHGIGPTGQRHHRPMMIGIHGLVQQGHTGYGPNDIDQRPDDVGIPTFTEIRHTFDDLVHPSAFSTMTCIRCVPLSKGSPDKKKAGG
ncbi:MAG: hypothetical protein K0S58_1561 [Nitrospira sp.]|nr:hypothetical protein [Nitrospira sp.]